MRKRVFKALYVTRIVIIRLLPVVLFAWGAVMIATYVDRKNVEAAAGEDYINYTSFVVQNAREGEDVYFQVCRDHEKNYNFNGNLSVYVIASTDDKPVQVYARDIKGSISNECDNKVILAKDYRHSPNTYEMNFCIQFRVEYDIEKTVCKKSNRYRIYPTPGSFDEQIKSLEERIRVLQQSRDDAIMRGDTSGQPETLSVPQQNPSTSTTPSTPNRNGNGNNPGGNGGGQQQTPPADPCIATVLGVKLFCRQGI